MSDITTTTTTLNPDIYRFSGFKYSLRSPSTWGPDEIIPENSSLYTYPKDDDGDEN